MLPPTSPQNCQPQYNSHITPSRPAIPLPPSFSGTKEPPALPTSRPESSMSISSMLGADVEQTTKDHSTTHRNGIGSSMNGTGASPMQQTTNAASSPVRRELGQTIYRRRSPSPVDRQIPQRVSNRPFRAFSNDAQRNTPLNARPTSPKAPTFRSSLGKIITQKSPASEHRPGGQQWKFSHQRHSSGGKTGKRPSSQPSSYSTPTQVVELNRPPRSAVSTSERYRDLQVAQKYDKLAQEARQKFDYGPADRPSQQFLEDHIRRVREERAALTATNQKSPKSSSQPRLVTRPNISTSFPKNQLRTDIESVDHVYNRDPQDVPVATSSPFSPDYLRRSREEKLAVNEPQPPNLGHSNPMQTQFLAQLEAQHRQQYPHTQPTSTATLNRSVSTNGIDQASKVGDDIIIQQPRHSLSLLIENGKRGRVSPLPQAVQGAQARNSGPASDPGIKNEFGRMFSGIGSGVGSSGPMGSGTSTPFPASPKINNEPERRTPFASRGEINEIARFKDWSKLGRRGLGREDDSRAAESDARRAPSVVGTLGARGIKKKHAHHHHR